MSRSALATAGGARVLARDHPSHGSHQLLSLFIWVARAAMTVDQAVTDVAVQQTQRHLVQGCPDGIDLGHDVDTVAILVDHLGHAPNLALDLGQAVDQLILGRRVSANLCWRQA